MEADLFHLLLINAHRVSIEMAEELAHEHVSVMGLLAAQLLARQGGPRSPRDLAAHLGCSRQSATEIVDRLVRDELAVRAADPNDGRAKIVSLTELGKTNGGFAEEALVRCLNSFTADFTAEQKETLHALLAKLLRGADFHRYKRLWETPWSRPKRGVAHHVR